MGKTKTYTVEVEEVRHYTVLYTVEARSKAEAARRAENGDTVDEEELKCHGVMDRHLHTEPEEVEPTT